MTAGDEFRRRNGDIIFNSEALIRKNVGQMLNAVIRRTPTVKGFLKNSWNTTLNNPNGEVASNPDPSGSRARQQVFQTLRSFKLGDSIHFTNNMPYAEYVEYGTQYQRAQLMLTSVFRRYREYFNRPVSGGAS